MVMPTEFEKNINTDITLDPDLKARWVEALRSGKYKQGKGALEKYNCNCCLGVLARVENVPVLDEDHQEKHFVFTEDEKNGQIMYPPQNWCGLDDATIYALADLNDSGYTFDQIAKLIEEKL
jgi:hypothetical protein